jgi:hypothetical protein
MFGWFSLPRKEAETELAVVGTPQTDGPSPPGFAARLSEQREPRRRMSPPLILKRASASRPSGEWKGDDFDVLADGAVVEARRRSSRITKVEPRGHRLYLLGLCYLSGLCCSVPSRAAYGRASLNDVAAVLKKFPRYQFKPYDEHYREQAP